MEHNNLDLLTRHATQIEKIATHLGNLSNDQKELKRLLYECKNGFGDKIILAQKEQCGYAHNRLDNLKEDIRNLRIYIKEVKTDVDGYMDKRLTEIKFIRMIITGISSAVVLLGTLGVTIWKILSSYH